MSCKQTIMIWEQTGTKLPNGGSYARLLWVNHREIGRISYHRPKYPILWRNEKKMKKCTPDTFKSKFTRIKDTKSGKFGFRAMKLSKILYTMHTFCTHIWYRKLHIIYFWRSMLLYPLMTHINSVIFLIS